MTKRDREFAATVARAERAGAEAARAARPTPMVVEQHASPFDDRSPVVESWYVPGGVCGFAWVNVKPGTSAFAKYLKRTGKARRDSYYGGVTVWCPLPTQSMETKEAWATAYASELRSAGYDARMMSRMD